MPDKYFQTSYATPSRSRSHERSHPLPPVVTGMEKHHYIHWHTREARPTIPSWFGKALRPKSALGSCRLSLLASYGKGTMEAMTERLVRYTLIRCEHILFRTADRLQDAEASTIPFRHAPEIPATKNKGSKVQLRSTTS